MLYDEADKQQEKRSVVHIYRHAEIAELQTVCEQACETFTMQIKKSS